MFLVYSDIQKYKNFKNDYLYLTEVIKKYIHWISAFLILLNY